MTEAKYIAAFRDRWPSAPGAEASADTLRLADEAVRDFPRSAKLWVIRGDLIQLGTGDTPYTLDDALSSYQTALHVDPTCAEALESIGHYSDAVLGDESAARTYFEQATWLRQPGAA